MDRLPKNALVIARIEKEAGINGSYYFRIVKGSYDENIIMKTWASVEVIMSWQLNVLDLIWKNLGSFTL